LPNVLNVLIIEYITSIHDIKKSFTKPIVLESNTTCTIKNGIVWIYNYIDDELCTEIIDMSSSLITFSLSNPNSIAVDTLPTGLVNIYVLSCHMGLSNKITIFDEKFVKKRNILVSADYVYSCIAAKNEYACIYSKKLPNCTIVHLTNINNHTIILESPIRHVVMENNDMYILTEDNHISQHALNGELIHTISISNDKIISNMNSEEWYTLEFCIIDNFFYICGEHIYVYDIDGTYITHIFCIFPLKIYSDTDTIYIQSGSLFPRLSKYDITKCNIAKLLKN